MKKFILGFILFAVSAFVFSPVLASSPEVKDSTEQVMQSLQDVNPTVAFVTEKIEAMAQSLKVPAEHVYKVLVKQQEINAYSTISLIGFLAVLSFVFIYGTLKYYNYKNAHYRKLHPEDYSVKNNQNYKNYDFDQPQWVIPTIIGIVLGLSSVVGIMAESSDIIMGLFNPEYGAIQDILEVLK
jgi:hypothetical protein